jgi:putative redox protein
MGGSNMGFSGGELFLVGLGGCFMSNLLAAIKARESAIQDVSIDILARADGSPTKLQEITLDVRASYTDRSEVEKLVLIAERGCIVANSIKDAIKLTIRVV